MKKWKAQGWEVLFGFGVILAILILGISEARTQNAMKIEYCFRENINGDLEHYDCKEDRDLKLVCSEEVDWSVRSEGFENCEWVEK